MMNPRRRRDRNSQGSEGEESENPFFDGDGSSSDEQLDRPRRNHMEDNRCWESGMRVNIPEFDGDTLNPRGFIDWLVAVEEVFEFKEVPENKRVSLITTKLLGRAFAWWQQFKLTRERVGNPRETDDQLVSCYIDGLRVQTMDSVNMFDPVTLSDAYQRGGSSSSNVASHFVPNQEKPSGGSGLKCFNCGETHHRQSECKKSRKRALFAEPKEWEDDGMDNDDYKEALVFYDNQYE
ncbi:reverse transcriptase domain-containing protein [Tanacetum coccineum]